MAAGDAAVADDVRGGSFGVRAAGARGRRPSVGLSARSADPRTTEPLRAGFKISDGESWCGVCAGAEGAVAAAGGGRTGEGGTGTEGAAGGPGVGLAGARAPPPGAGGA